MFLKYAIDLVKPCKYWMWHVDQGALLTGADCCVVRDQIPQDCSSALGCQGCVVGVFNLLVMFPWDLAMGIIYG